MHFSFNSLLQTTAAQLYKANRVLADNGGEADTSVARPTRHNPPASVMGSYHNTAQGLGDIVARHTHSAMTGALSSLQKDIRIGRPNVSLDLGMVQEQACLLAAREVSETLHGDSAMARTLHQFASAAGPPSTFTTLPGNGQLFNSRNIPSSNRNHREQNNRLEGVARVDGRTNRGPAGTGALYPAGVNPSTARLAAAAAVPAAPTAAAAAGAGASSARPPMAGRVLFEREEGAAASGTASAAGTGGAESSPDSAFNDAVARSLVYAKMESASERNLAESMEMGGRKRPPEEGQPAPAPPAPSAAVVSTTKKKAARKKPPPTVSEAVNSALESHLRSAPSGTAHPMPGSFADVDTSFFTATPRTNPVPRNPVGAVARGGSGLEASDATALDQRVQDLSERALARSFSETGANSMAFNVETGQEEPVTSAGAAAIRRVNFLMDKPESAGMLIGLFVQQNESSGKSIDSPAVNKMLDMFARNNNN